jgi:MerR family redox-sensitive transcriptional activator SoxR
MKIEDDPLMSISDFAAQRRQRIGAALLRVAGSDRIGAQQRRKAALPPLACGASPTSCLRSVGFTLEEIAAQLARLPTRHVPTGGDWQKMSRIWQQRLDERIDELQRLRDSLNQCIGCGCCRSRSAACTTPATNASAAARAAPLARRRAAGRGH